MWLAGCLYSQSRNGVDAVKLSREQRHPDNPQHRRNKNQKNHHNYSGSRRSSRDSSTPDLGQFDDDNESIKMVSETPFTTPRKALNYEAISDQTLSMSNPSDFHSNQVSSAVGLNESDKKADDYSFRKVLPFTFEESALGIKSPEAVSTELLSNRGTLNERSLQSSFQQGFQPPQHTVMVQPQQELASLPQQPTLALSTNYLHLPQYSSTSFQPLSSSEQQSPPRVISSFDYPHQFNNAFEQPSSNAFPQHQTQTSFQLPSGGVRSRRRQQRQMENTAAMNNSVQPKIASQPMGISQAEQIPYRSRQQRSARASGPRMGYQRGSRRMRSDRQYYSF